MPGRVREFNAIQAAAIAATLGIAVPIAMASRACGGSGSGAAGSDVRALPELGCAGSEVLLGVRAGDVKAGNEGTGNRRRADGVGEPARRRVSG